MSLPLPLTHGCLFVDHSYFFEPAMQCPTKLQNVFLHRRIKDDFIVATDFGTCIHNVFEYRYKIHGTAAVTDQGKKDIETIIQRHFDASPSPFGDRRNINFAQEIADRYLEKHPTESFLLMEMDEYQCGHCDGTGLAAQLVSNTDGIERNLPCFYCHGTGRTKAMVELPFVHLLYTHTLADGTKVPVYYIGKIDLPLQREQKVFVMDHKTTSVLDKNFFLDKKASQQTMMYAYEFQQLTGIKVDGFAINVVHTKEVPDYVTQGTPYKGQKKTPKQYWEQAMVREFHYVTQEKLVAAKDNAINLCEEFFWRHSRGIFTRNTSSCVPKYGPCPYYTACHEIDEKDRLDYLASGAFVDQRWTPLNKVRE